MRIGEEARKGVVFFGVDGAGDTIDYGGTGFLVVDQENGVSVPFLVTCRHVAQTLSNHDRFYIRANTLDGESIPLTVEKMEWAYHPDRTVDLAAVNLLLPAHSYDVIYYAMIPDAVIMDESDKKRVLGGDFINIVGLFRLHSGKQRNLPFVHSGSVAVLADPRERIPIRDRVTNELIEAEVYLVEVQTLDGLSGSPVFVHEIVDLKHLKLTSKIPGEFSVHALGLVRLLGLYSGSWDGEPGQILAADRNLRGGKRVPVGVGTVIPAGKIIELIREHPTLQMDRKNISPLLCLLIAPLLLRIQRYRILPPTTQARHTDWSLGS